MRLNSLLIQIYSKRCRYVDASWHWNVAAMSVITKNNILSKDYINHDKIKFNTIDFDKPKEKYIVIELIGKENNKKGNKYY